MKKRRLKKKQLAQNESTTLFPDISVMLDRWYVKQPEIEKTSKLIAKLGIVSFVQGDTNSGECVDTQSDSKGSCLFTPREGSLVI